MFDLDEGVYASCSRQMVLSGDWTTPRINSRAPAQPTIRATPFFEKPILIYWLAAAAMRSFGVSAWSARIPVALAALLTTLLVAYIGARWFSPRIGLFAAIIYATAPITVLDARQLTTDGLLVLWFTLALLAFKENQSARPGSIAGRLAAALFWIACALAILTKGAIGIVLPSLVICVSLGLNRLTVRATARRGAGPSFRLSVRLASMSRIGHAVRALVPVAGVVLVVAITAPWHLAIWRAGGHDALGHTWVQEYLIRQHIGRFKGLDTVHNAPLPSYLVFFLVGFFPWACFAPAAFRSNIAPHARHAVLFLLVWFWTIFIFFSAAAAKLPTYIAPAYPAAALLMGRWLDGAIYDEPANKATRTLRNGAAAAAITALLLMVAAMFGPRFAPPRAPIPPDIQRLALHITGLLFCGCGAAWFCFLRTASASAARRATGVGLLVVMLFLVVGVGSTEGYATAARDILEPYQHAAAAAQTDAARGVPVIFYHVVPRRPSMNYYAAYSPFERKEEPLLPFLRQVVPAGTPTIDVVTSKEVYAGALHTELLARPDVSCSLVAQFGADHGGWVLLTLRNPHGFKPVASIQNPPSRIRVIAP